MAIDDAFSTWKCNDACILLGQDLVSLIHTLDQDERAHMDQEESFLLPCMRAYFTESELSGVQRRMGQEGGHSGSFVHVIGEERFRNHTMPRFKIPFFVWNLAFKPELKHYQEQVVQQVEALETNVQPAVKKGSWFGRR
jgi:iron-sulfur cluster repair protein YtfE (RIC family)